MGPGLDARTILTIWEGGLALRPLDRAALILWHAEAQSEGAPGTDPADLPLAVRDRTLLSVRRATFGDPLALIASCVGCGTDIELDLRAGALAENLSAPVTESVLLGGHQHTLRALTSRDLAALAALPDAARGAAARARLTGADAAVDADEAAALDARIEAREAEAEIAFTVRCPECGAVAREMLDVAACVWIEIENAARRLMVEVADIARTFGWSEDAILAFGPSRRAAYLALAREP